MNFFNGFIYVLGYLCFFCMIVIGLLCARKKLNGTWDEDKNAHLEYEFESVTEQVFKYASQVTDEALKNKIGHSIGTAFVGGDRELLNKINERLQQVLGYKKGETDGV